MAITLAQLAQIETEPLRKYILENMVRDTKVMDLLPFENVDSLRSIAVRWQNLPSVAFRAIGGNYTASEGQTEQVWESVYILGGTVQWDRVFEKVKNTITDMKKLQLDMKLKSLSCTFNNYLINGDPATDILGFTGLKKRVALSPARQTVYFAGSSAAALDATADAASGRAFFNGWEQMHYCCNGGQVSAFLCNENMYYGVGKVARYINAAGGSFLDVTKDSFDRQITTYKGVPIVDVGLLKDQATEIIPDTEVAGDSGVDATSIYACSFNMDQGITGIQLGPLENWETEPTSTAPHHTLNIEWVLGLAGFGSYGVVRGANCEGASNWT